VTLQLLHVEYLEQHPDGYRYSQFCEHYRAWLAKRKLTMRQEHLAGDKLFVDYSGKRARLVDPTSGEVTEVELFVAVLGASNYTYAEATRTQQGPDWIASHVRALTFFGGVPAAIVPDQLKSGVTTACRYEPGIQRTYEELATHYGTTVLPARPLHPRDKAKVEVAVQIAQRWILARLRHQTFFSLDALNDRIAELVTDLNDRVMRVYGVSRRALFDRTDGPALRTLPAERFVYGTWKKARVNIDYHVEIEHHYYSAPHALAREEVYARITDATVEIHHRGEQVAVHVRSASRGRHTTVPGHMPALHQKHLEWTPSRIIHWAGTIGPCFRCSRWTDPGVHDGPEHAAGDLDGIVTDLESYLVRRMVCDLGTKNYNRFFLSMLQKLRGSTDPISRATIQQMLLAPDGSAGEWPDDKKFARAWLERPLYDTLKPMRCSMLLEAVDRAMRTSKQEAVTINGRLTVEHVLPQQWAPPAWPEPPADVGNDDETAIERRGRLLHSLGNLTLLTQELNSSVSNGPFAAKRPEIAKQSVLRLNTYFQDATTWDEDEIAKRGDKLLEHAKRIWPRPQPTP
jgi:transposase